MEASESLREALEKLARACRILEMEGHGDMSLGHLSLRDPDGRGFWMKRNRAGLGEIAGPGDFVLVGMDGTKIAGEGGRHTEWPIHAEILRLRADVQVVAHTHPFHACVFSASTEPLQPYTLDADYFVDVPRFADAVALVATPEEGSALAAALGGNFVVVMANHGITFCGSSIEHATCVGIFFEKACRAQLAAQSAALEVSLPSRAVRAKRHAQIMTPAHVEHSWNFFSRKLDWLVETRLGGKPTLYV